MGLFSFVGGLLGGGAQKKASQKATTAMVAALNRGIDTQNAFQQQTRSDYLPYTEAGTSAINELARLTNGSLSGAQLFDTIKANPLYQSLYDSGGEALLQNASATGGLRGGNTQRGLADFGADTMAKVYQQALSNLGSVAGLGLGGQNTVTSAGQGVTNNVTALLGDIGNAQAQNYLTKGGINARNWQNAGALVDSAVSAFLPGGISKGTVARLNPIAQGVIRANPSIF